MNVPNATPPNSPSETPPVVDPAAKILDNTDNDQAKEPPKEEEKKEPAAPETVTPESITLPEGVEADQAALGKFSEIMNNAELSPKARAQALVDLQVDLMKQASEKGSQAWLDTVEKWGEETRADPEIGGDALEPNLAKVSRLIDEYATDKDGKPDKAFATQLREFMDLTGAGNNPVAIKFLVRLANKLVVEGGPVKGDPGNRARGREDIIYDK